MRTGEDLEVWCRDWPNEAARKVSELLDATASFMDILSHMDEVPEARRVWAALDAFEANPDLPA